MVSLPFRYRKRASSLIAIYACFNAPDVRLLHPVEISRETGIHLLDVRRTLERTPELFMKVPGRGDGITRYGLPNSVAAMTEAQVEHFIRSNARRESWVYYALLVSFLAALLLTLLSTVPAIVSLMSANST